MTATATATPTSTTTLKRTIPQISLDSQALYDRIKKAAIGDVITYDELTGIISRDVTSSGKGCLSTAVRTAMREHRMVFACVRCVGIKRLADSEIVGVGIQATKRIRRAAGRGIRKLACVHDFDRLTPQQKLQHNTQLSVLGALHQFCKEPSIKKVEQKVAKSERRLSFAGTLEALRRGIPKAPPESPPA